MKNRKIVASLSAMLALGSVCAPAALASPIHTSHRNVVNAPRNLTKELIRNATNNGSWQSSNWSGYSMKGDQYKSISADWTVTKLGKSQDPSFASAWIGIDGATNSDLIQTGTEEDFTNGKVHYDAWWEILPNAETQLNTAKYPVSAGDQMHADIHDNGDGTWTILLQNKTKGWTFSTKKSYAGPGASAEWIVEAPTINGQVGALSNFGTMTFKNATVNGKNPQFTQSESGVLVQNGQPVDSTSAPNADGNGFTVSYKGSSANPTTVPTQPSVSPSTAPAPTTTAPQPQPAPQPPQSITLPQPSTVPQPVTIPPNTTAPTSPTTVTTQPLVPQLPQPWSVQPVPHQVTRPHLVGRPHHRIRWRRPHSAAPYPIVVVPSPQPPMGLTGPSGDTPTPNYGNGMPGSYGVPTPNGYGMPGSVSMPNGVSGGYGYGGGMGGAVGMPGTSGFGGQGGYGFINPYATMPFSFSNFGW